MKERSDRRTSQLLIRMGLWRMRRGGILLMRTGTWLNGDAGRPCLRKRKGRQDRHLRAMKSTCERGSLWPSGPSPIKTRSNPSKRSLNQFHFKMFPYHILYLDIQKDMLTFSMDGCRGKRMRSLYIMCAPCSIKWIKAYF